MRNLKEDREILDDIDKKIIGLLEERMKNLMILVILMKLLVWLELLK